MPRGTVSVNSLDVQIIGVTRELSVSICAPSVAKISLGIPRVNGQEESASRRDAEKDGPVEGNCLASNSAAPRLRARMILDRTERGVAAPGVIFHFPNISPGPLTSSISIVENEYLDPHVMIPTVSFWRS